MEKLIRKVSIKARLISLILILFAFISGLGVYATSSVATVNNMLNHMFENQLVPIANLADANMQAIYHNRSLFRYVIESDPDKMAEIARDMDDNEKQMNKLLDQYASTELTQKEEELLRRVQTAWDSYEDASEKVKTASLKQQNDLAMDLVRAEVNGAFNAADSLLTELVQLNIQLADKSYKDSDVIVAQIDRNTTTLIVVVLVICGGFGGAIIASIVRPVNEISEDLRSLSMGDLTGLTRVIGNDEITNMQQAMAASRKQLSTTIEAIVDANSELTSCGSELVNAANQVMKSSSEQANAATASASSLREMVTSITTLASSAKNANQLAIDSGKVAQASENQVEKVSTQITLVSSSINDSAEQLRKLASSIQQVSQISVMIKGVADQTNLLALNAAIEAARAGEQGRGFAVVADEVRQLAARTTEATQEIDQMISTVQQSTTRTVTDMDASIQTIEAVKQNAASASSQMAAVDKSSRDMVHLMADITSTLQEQSSSSDSVVASVDQMNSMSKENETTASKVTQGSARLAEVVKKLDKNVAFFKLA